MCKLKRLGQISLLLLCIALLAMMSGCGRLIPIRQPSTGTDLTETSKETDPTVNIKDTEMTEEALVALTMMRQSLVETPCLFAAAFLGYLEAPTGDLAAWLPQGVNAQLLEDLPFVGEIRPAQTTPAPIPRKKKTASSRLCSRLGSVHRSARFHFKPHHLTPAYESGTRFMLRLT